MSEKDNMRFFLNELLKCESNPVRAEYLFDELRQYIENKKEVYKEVLEEYNQDELNKNVRLGYEQYKKRATSIFRKELMKMVVLVFILTIIFAYIIKIDPKYLLLILLASFALFSILRVSYYKKELEKRTNLEYDKHVEKEIKDFVEGLKK